MHLVVEDWGSSQTDECRRRRRRHHGKIRMAEVAFHCRRVDSWSQRCYPVLRAGEYGIDGGG